MTDGAVAETPFWQRPAEQSPACTRLLDRIERGTWRPAESTLWRDPKDAAQHARVHEWEWRNLILHAYCAQLADHPDRPWPVARLPHCPNVVYEPVEDRHFGTKFLQALCVCREPDTGLWAKGWDQRAHWISRWYDSSENRHRDVPMYCHCGGPEEPPGSGMRWINDDGYVCESCARLLVTVPYQYGWRPNPTASPGHVGDGPSWSHPLKCDCRCCYCGGRAEAQRGWRLTCHPAISTPGVTEVPADDRA